jgi:hypothetical protein
VVRIDAATNKVGLRVPLDGPVASDGNEVWIAGPNGLPEVVRIDPVSGKVITTVDLDTVPGDLAVGLDEATGRIIGRVDIVAASRGADWIDTSRVEAVSTSSR